MDSAEKVDRQMYSDILSKYRNMRMTNINLLEEKRSFLLRISELNKFCVELQNQLKKENAYESDSHVSSTTEKMEETEKHLMILQRQKIEHDLLHRTAELIDAKEENIRYREHIAKLQEKLRSCTCGTGDGVAETRRRASADEIEAIKHQLVVYQEDFNSEKSDKEKAEAEGRLLKGKLREAEDFIHALKQETVRYENALRGLTDEKITLKREIRRLSTSSLPLSPVRRTYMDMKGKEDSFDLDESDVVSRHRPKPKLMRMPSDVLYGGDLVRD